MGFEPIARGTGRFWRTNLALFAAGLATFALMYAVQPLMPVFSAAFGVSPAASSLTLSVTTLPLAFGMLGASLLADRWGRKRVMVASLLASAVLGAACAGAPGFAALLVLRALMGLSLAGLPSIAMTYLSEVTAPAAAGLAMGLFIGGSAVGGMSGRLLAGLLAEHTGWRAALSTVAALGLLCGALLWRFLPPGPPPEPHTKPTNLAYAFATHLRRGVMLRLFAQGFLLMGGFVSVYNYVAYRLLAPPYAMSQTAVSLIFSVYLLGVVSSAVMGNLALRAGRRRTLLANIVVMACGLALTLAAPVWAIVGGVATLTAGFFGAHSVASAWVGHAARTARAQASALYLLAYYGGSSVAGSLCGVAWSRFGWDGVAGCVGVMLACCFLAAAGLPGHDGDLGQNG